ncbi:ferric reductase [Heterobasidion irregulare TC 32-1]|uniref:ferric-chelate reductase (NADPH) n=1 Tax=Heterobasidion irregulare (strain TC 32-1) TaxID=747525 RepID=W4JPG1_HETIT|nr:ferric reductase [Heterobasidion irregulare TC 32-1]ETW75457.1 ferric reductase [Heterobasidion irregulare TC 32-1]
MNSIAMQAVSPSSPELASEMSHTLNSHAHLILHATESAPALAHSPPTRVPRWSTLIHPFVSYAINYRVAPSLSVGKLFVLAVYLGVIFYAAFYKSNPFTDPARAGFVAMSQIPIVIGLANKNNLLSYLCGVAYEKLNYIHRFSGRIVALAVNVHAIGFLYKWSINDNISTQLLQPHIRWGLAGLAAVDTLALFSIAFIRQKLYNLFFYSHIAGFIVFLTAAYQHFPITLPYVVTGFALFGLDHVLRLCKTRVAAGTLFAIPALNSTHISVPSLGAGWRAGQHVRIRVVAASPTGSWIGCCWAWLVGRARPFTIATASGDDLGLELIVKKYEGGWTGRLFEMAQAQDGGMEEKTIGLPKHSIGRRVRVIVEGPYSGPGHTLFASYSGALLVAGGSGITFVLSILADLLQKHGEGRSRLRVIEVVWSVADPSALTALLPTFTTHLRPRASPHGSLQVRISIYYTRAPRAGALDALSSLSHPVGLNLRPGRPNLGKHLTETTDAVVLAHSMRHASKGSEQYPCGVIVGTCGPVDLGDEAGKAVGSVPWKKWKEVGGVEAYDEVFGW